MNYCHLEIGINRFIGVCINAKEPNFLLLTSSNKKSFGVEMNGLWRSESINKMFTFICLVKIILIAGIDCRTLIQEEVHRGSDETYYSVDWR